MTNAAQKLYTALGVAIEDKPKVAHGSKNASARKSGPGRYARQGQEDGGRKARPTRAYAALMEHFAQKRVTKHDPKRRDEHGTFTWTGRNPDGSRRKWVAGVSASRVQA